MTPPSVYLQQHVVPAAYALLPPKMNSPAATAMLLAIALQESRMQARRQFSGGPARGFWQFELGGGIVGVLTHRASKPHLEAALQTLSYVPAASALYDAIEHNDVLAAVCARLLLWTLPTPLPTCGDAEEGWRQYLEAWRPGKPHRATWDHHFATGWALAGEGV